MRNEVRPRSRAAADAVDRFQFVLEELVGRLGNLGAIAAIDVRGIGRRYFAAGHADITRTRPAKPMHLYQIGSQTKTLLALALLRVHRTLGIDLDGSARNYVDLPVDPRITVRHLLMNQSGLGEMLYGIPPARWDPRLPIEPRTLVALALPQGQLFDPGSRFDYCNTGWVIAALVLESVANKSYRDAMRELVIDPLSLADTSVGGEAPVERMMRGYMASQATGGELIDASAALSWAFGAGDAVSSLDDMLDLFAALCRPDMPLGIALADLNATTGKPSSMPYFPMSAGIEYGIGIERQSWAGREVWGHPGSTYSYASGTWVDPERAIIVTTCVTRKETHPPSPDVELRYPRAQLFSMALNTAYALAHDQAR